MALFTLPTRQTFRSAWFNVSAVVIGRRQKAKNLFRRVAKPLYYGKIYPYKEKCKAFGRCLGHDLYEGTLLDKTIKGAKGEKYLNATLQDELVRYLEEKKGRVDGRIEELTNTIADSNTQLDNLKRDIEADAAAYYEQHPIDPNADWERKIANLRPGLHEIQERDNNRAAELNAELLTLYKNLYISEKELKAQEVAQGKIGNDLTDATNAQRSNQPQLNDDNEVVEDRGLANKFLGITFSTVLLGSLFFLPAELIKIGIGASLAITAPVIILPIVAGLIVALVGFKHCGRAFKYGAFGRLVKNTARAQVELDQNNEAVVDSPIAQDESQTHSPQLNTVNHELQQESNPKSLRGALGNTGIFVLLGAAFGTLFFPGFGTLIGAAVGAGLGAISFVGVANILRSIKAIGVGLFLGAVVGASIAFYFSRQKGLGSQSHLKDMSRFGKIAAILPGIIFAGLAAVTRCARDLFWGIGSGVQHGFSRGYRLSRDGFNNRYGVHKAAQNYLSLASMVVVGVAFSVIGLLSRGVRDIVWGIGSGMQQGFSRGYRLSRDGFNNRYGVHKEAQNYLSLASMVVVGGAFSVIGLGSRAVVETVVYVSKFIGNFLAGLALGVFYGFYKGFSQSGKETFARKLNNIDSYVATLGMYLPLLIVVPLGFVARGMRDIVWGIASGVQHGFSRGYRLSREGFNHRYGAHKEAKNYLALFSMVLIGGAFSVIGLVSRGVVEASVQTVNFIRNLFLGFGLGIYHGFLKGFSPLENTSYNEKRNAENLGRVQKLAMSVGMVLPAVIGFLSRGVRDIIWGIGSGIQHGFSRGYRLSRERFNHRYGAHKGAQNYLALFSMVVIGAAFSVIGLLSRGVRDIIWGIASGVQHGFSRGYRLSREGFNNRYGDHKEAQNYLALVSMVVIGAAFSAVGLVSRGVVEAIVLTAKFIGNVLLGLGLGMYHGLRRGFRPLENTSYNEKRNAENVGRVQKFAMSIGMVLPALIGLLSRAVRDIIWGLGSAIKQGLKYGYAMHPNKIMVPDSDNSKKLGALTETEGVQQHSWHETKSSHMRAGRYLAIATMWPLGYLFSFFSLSLRVGKEIFQTIFSVSTKPLRDIKESAKKKWFFTAPLLVLASVLALAVGFVALCGKGVVKAGNYARKNPALVLFAPLYYLLFQPFRHYVWQPLDALANNIAAVFVKLRGKRLNRIKLGADTMKLGAVAGLLTAGFLSGGALVVLLPVIAAFIIAIPLISKISKKLQTRSNNSKAKLAELQNRASQPSGEHGTSYGSVGTTLAQGTGSIMSTPASKNIFLKKIATSLRQYIEERERSKVNEFDVKSDTRTLQAVYQCFIDGRMSFQGDTADQFKEINDNLQKNPRRSNAHGFFARARVKDDCFIRLNNVIFGSDETSYEIRYNKANDHIRITEVTNQTKRQDAVLTTNLNNNQSDQSDQATSESPAGPSGEKFVTWTLLN